MNVGLSSPACEFLVTPGSAGLGAQGEAAGEPRVHRRGHCGKVGTSPLLCTGRVCLPAPHAALPQSQSGGALAGCCTAAVFATFTAQYRAEGLVGQSACPEGWAVYHVPSNSDHALMRWVLLDPFCR